MKSKIFAFIGIIILLILVFVAIFAPLISPYNPFEITGQTFEKPSANHILGTNDIGQDIFSELIYGTRTSLLIGFISAIISTCIGFILGCIAGYFGGFIDRVIMKIITFFFTIPFIPSLIILSVFVKVNVFSTAMILGIMGFASVARLIRSETIRIKSKDYIVTIKAMGASSFYIIFFHILKELLPLILYRFSDRIKAGILSESSLAFLGLGDITSKSWGSVIYYAQSKNALITGSWVWWIMPAGALICIVCFALILISYSSESFKDKRIEA